MSSSNIDIKFFNEYIVNQFLNVSEYSRDCNIDGMSNLSNLINNTSSKFVVDIGSDTILNILEYNADNMVGDISNIHNIYCNEDYITHFSNQNVLEDGMECNFTLDEEGLLKINDNYILSMKSNNCNIIDISTHTTWGSSNDTYYDYYNRYNYFSNLENEIELVDYNIKTAFSQKLINDVEASANLVIINNKITEIVNANEEKDLKSLRIYVTALKYYYYVILLVITHYVISKLTAKFSDYQPYIDIETKFREKLSRKNSDLNNFNVDGNRVLKDNIKDKNDLYKANVDKYKTKNNELNNILKNNLYNNIFLYITIVVLILICLGIIYISNHKASLKSQYAIMIIAFLILYYIVYTNMTVNITESFDSQENKDLLNKLILKVIGYLESVKNNIDNQYIYSALNKEKNKYDGFAKSSNSKLNNLELVLNDEFINAIKSKELVKFLILFTAICIISYIVYTNTEDPATTSIIFIILLIIILMIYFYNINLMTRTKADTKYWNHRMVMK
jgi:hypothetical protein